MSLLEAVSHLIGLAMPALVQGILVASIAKWIWRKELSGRRWTGLTAWASAASFAAIVGGLILTGHDGTMAAYAAVVLASAAAVWIRGFVRF